MNRTSKFRPYQAPKGLSDYIFLAPCLRPSEIELCCSLSHFFEKKSEKHFCLSTSKQFSTIKITKQSLTTHKRRRKLVGVGTRLSQPTDESSNSCHEQTYEN